MPRRYGARKDERDDRDHIAIRSLATLPNLVTMEINLGPVRNQGDAGSCTGQAGGGLLDWLYRSQYEYFGNPGLYNPEFSALFLYAEERVKNGTFPSDSGSDSRTCMQVLNQLGACLNILDPYSDTAIAEMPTQAMVAAALPFRIGAYHRVLLGDGGLTAKSVLASKYCHILGIPVYQAIESDEVAETGIVPVPTAGQTPIGGHELLVYGYSEKQESFLVRNSWGADWGLKGNLLLPFGYYAAAGGDTMCDAWVGHMGRPWS